MNLNPSNVAVFKPGSRNPARSRERILAAAFHEFAAKGFAGARVDTIAARAGINKRMLYHYFGDKEKLFREVLRRKIAERQAWMLNTPDDPGESLPFWFELACKDPEWIRLLEWEALQFVDGRLIDEPTRREAAQGGVTQIRGRQSRGHLAEEFEPERILLAMVALTWFPLAFPQLTKFITGQSVLSSQFRSEQQAFLRKFAGAFRAKKSERQPRKDQNNSSEARSRASRNTRKEGGKMEAKK